MLGINPMHRKDAAFRALLAARIVWIKSIVRRLRIIFFVKINSKFCLNSKITVPIPKGSIKAALGEDSWIGPDLAVFRLTGGCEGQGRPHDRLEARH